MIGKILSGKYEIIELLGTGGMACVYKATQISPPYRTVAIKTPKEQFINDAEFLRRFKTEANAVLVLSHENVVRSYDVGQDGDIPYIVLEYVEGSPLKDIIKEKSGLPARAVVNYGVQMLDALGHAHDKGIIHRDIKPQNIIVNKLGKVKLTDFGIARISFEGDTMTYSGNGLLGSVHYFSPEQAKGKPCTVESDIYSMGVTLYEMATGRVPFSGDSSVAVALMHLQDKLVEPIEINPKLPPSLNDVIVRALNKKPSMRYKSAKKMRRDLLRVLRDPKGTYARLKPEETETEKPAVKAKKGVNKIALTTVLTVALFAALLIAGQFILKSMIEDNSAVLAPTLVGKTIVEAQKLAELRGFRIVEAARVSNQDIENGVIFEQSPTAGTEVKGGVIEVFISLGSGEQTVVPDVTGKTLAEAQLLLSEAGLETGTVDYRTSEFPSGQVFKQDPVVGMDVLKNDEVSLIVSGVPTRSLEAPDALGRQLTTALNMFFESDFTRFRVRKGEIHEIENLVTKQNPSKGEFGNQDTIVSFTITVSEYPEYGTIVPLTMDVTQDDTELMIIVECEGEGIPYELVVHEQLLKKGKQELLLDIPSEEPGMMELIVYLDGQESMRLPAVATSYADLVGEGE